MIGKERKRRESESSRLSISDHPLFPLTHHLLPSLFLSLHQKGDGDKHSSGSLNFERGKNDRHRQRIRQKRGKEIGRIILPYINIRGRETA
jgi:hypothetical protein